MDLKLSQKDRELCAIIYRNIWLKRNSYVFEGKVESPSITMNRVASQLEDYQEAQIQPSQSHTKKTIASVIKKWYPLVVHITKAN